METPNVTDAISHATCMTAMDINAAAIITITKEGGTARMISRYRPYSPIIGCTPLKKTFYQMGLSWGVNPVMINEETDTEELFTNSIKAAQQRGYIKKDEIAVITAGVPLGVSGTTNIIRVMTAE